MIATFTGDYVDCIYPIELEIKDTTDTTRYDLYIDLHIEIDSKELVKNQSFDKRYKFNFSINL
jgi:hypothetical protein